MFAQDATNPMNGGLIAMVFGIANMLDKLR
jgi:hypothetical protein